MKVFILTTVKSPATLRTGGTLVFDTIRQGFPTADITVFDNASAYGRDEIKASCQNISAQFTQFEKEVIHGKWIEEQINKYDDELVFVDPDVIFWNTMEGLPDQDALFLGREIPAYYEPFTNMWSVGRIHPSLFWIPSSEKLKYEIKKIKDIHQGYAINMFEAQSIPAIRIGERLLFDTISNLTATFVNKFFAFSEPYLNCYDHLFGGTYQIDDIYGDGYKTYRNMAESGDIKGLKGLWKIQQEFFSGVKA